jgi:hypothetical protein
MTPVEELFQLLWDTPKDKFTWFTIRKQMIEKEQEIMKKSFSNGFKWCCEREFTDEVFDDYNETFNVSEKMKRTLIIYNTKETTQEEAAHLLDILNCDDSTLWDNADHCGVQVFEVPTFKTK